MRRRRSRIQPTDPMGSRLLRPKRLLTLALLALSVGAAVWWIGMIPYDPQAIYRPIPASATMVGRHVALPARWNDLLANPLALALMRTAGVRTEDAAGLTAEEESRVWFEKLVGREAVWAYLPSRFGGAPSWMAVSHLGGESQKLRWQLSLFRVPGFERMSQFPRRSVWRVDTPDLEPGQTLVIAFGEGILMACVSSSPVAIAEVLGAYDGQVSRLLDEFPSFAQFASEDDRSIPDRLWILDDSDWAASDSPGLTVDIPVLRGDAISLSMETGGAVLVPEAGASISEMESLVGLLGHAPCTAVRMSPEAIGQLSVQPWVQKDVRHALRMVSTVATQGVVLAGMDGEMGGRLAWGAMSSLGLRGLRVPTVLLATPVSDAEAAEAAIQRMLDESNARYRGAFVLRPVAVPPYTLFALESAGGDEWVDALASSDRPAYAVVDGWLLTSSNLGALRKLAESASVRNEVSTLPAWMAQLNHPAALTAWVELARTGKVARDAIATWSMVQMFTPGGNSQEIREQLNEAKVWIEALAPFGTARVTLGRQDGKTTLQIDLGGGSAHKIKVNQQAAMDFGLSGDSLSDRISRP